MSANLCFHFTPIADRLESAIRERVSLARRVFVVLVTISSFFVVSERAIFAFEDACLDAENYALAAAIGAAAYAAAVASPLERLRAVVARQIWRRAGVSGDERGRGASVVRVGHPIGLFAAKIASTSDALCSFADQRAARRF